MPERNTDEFLLESAGAGDAAAFQELYERHRKPVFRFAYRLSGNVENAEDLTHDCFLSLIKRVASFDPGRASLRTYLLAATRNLWLKQLRTLGRESALDEFDENDFIAVGKAPLGRLLENELSQTVAEAVANLPHLQREALVLFEYEGISLNEIASMVGSDVGAVKARLHRARARLRKTLQPYLNSHREIVTLEKA
ncbi:MAG: sigma-70 family RNA polymerase sigma factor [Acidobacteria bacterium]|nr:sigma-70 family RNA polymerase sigma factor [Acidobacteriota bacterium]